MHKKMKKYSIGFLMAFSAAGLMACGDDAKNVVSNIANEPDLNGRYAGPCMDSELANLAMRETLRFQADGKFSRYQDFYSSADCTGDEVEGSVEVSGTYSVDNDGAPDAEGGAIELTLDKATVKVSSDVLAKALNVVNFCGASDYAAEKEVEISGGSDDALCPVRDVPDTLYGLYREDDKKLYLNTGGLTSMGQSDEERPKDLDQETVYVKQ